MSYAKDQWKSLVRDEDGNPVLDARGKPRKEWNDRRNKGKRWLAVWRGPDGREKTKAFRTEEEADTYAKSMDTDIARGAYIDPDLSKHTVGKYMDLLLASKAVGKDKGGLEQNSVEHYRQVDRLHIRPTFGDRAVGGVRNSCVLTWITGIKSTHRWSTVKPALELLRGALDLAADDKAIGDNPARSKSISAGTRDAKDFVLWDPEQLQGIIMGHTEQYRMFPYLGMRFGLRPAEIAAFSEEDIDEDNSQIHVRRQIKRVKNKAGAWVWIFAYPKGGKAGKMRAVALGELSASVFHEHIARFPPTPISLPFGTADGPVETRNVLLTYTGPRTGVTHLVPRSFSEHVWWPALIKAGLIPEPERDAHGNKRYDDDKELHNPHSLRHYFASDSLQRGVPITTVSAELGHSNPKVTWDTYAHRMPSGDDISRAKGDERTAEFKFFSRAGAEQPESAKPEGRPPAQRIAPPETALELALR